MLLEVEKKPNPLETPSMRQYLNIKEQYPDSILFFRLGDFYEMFLEDAEIASKILDISLTKRQNILMCGVPHHSCDFYISKLLKVGKKIAVCEQKKVFDKALKLIPREVVRVITPGTVIEDKFLPSFDYNFLAICLMAEEEAFLSFCDISTGDVFNTSFAKTNSLEMKALFLKFQPSEICFPKKQKKEFERSLDLSQYFYNLVDFESDTEKQPFDNLQNFLKQYLNSNYKDISYQLKKPIFLGEKQYLEMDSETILNLELVENHKESSHTLFHVLDFCNTSKGKRLLKQKILFPLQTIDKIQEKWQNLEKLKQLSTETISHTLKKIIDIERIITRFNAEKAYPRDFASISLAVHSAFELLEILQPANYPFYLSQSLKDLVDFIEERIELENLPSILGNGNFIRSGFDQKLDKAREAKQKGKDWMLELEQKEKQKTGINALKIRYNKVLGYFIEIPRTQSKFAPNTFIKKQTLVSTERYSNERLEEIQTLLLQSDQIVNDIEKEEFEKLRLKVLDYAEDLISLSEDLSELDCCLSFLKAAQKYNYIQPQINHEQKIDLKQARHPVVEAFLPNFEKFIPNDIYLDKSQNGIALLTGPNMAGKSTYMRQIALNQILFQMGSYVPCQSASFCLCDKLFTRIGAGDNLTSGESTFFVEMKETANIIKNSTQNSLAIFDEVGRGTATYDGLSIAWAIIEYLSKNKNSPKTIFATHYHELTSLEKMQGVFNLFMETYEEEDKVVFLKKVQKGKADKSFGLYVAELAGIPSTIVQRAKSLLEFFESKKKSIKIEEKEADLFTNLSFSQNTVSSKSQKIEERLKAFNLNEKTPLETMQFVKELQETLKQT